MNIVQLVKVFKELNEEEDPLELVLNKMIQEILIYKVKDLQI